MSGDATGTSSSDVELTSAAASDEARYASRVADAELAGPRFEQPGASPLGLRLRHPAVLVVQAAVVLVLSVFLVAPLALITVALVAGRARAPSYVQAIAGAVWVGVIALAFWVRRAFAHARRWRPLRVSALGPYQPTPVPRAAKLRYESLATVNGRAGGLAVTDGGLILVDRGSVVGFLPWPQVTRVGLIAPDQCAIEHRSASIASPLLVAGESRLFAHIATAANDAVFPAPRDTATPTTRALETIVDKLVLGRVAKAVPPRLVSLERWIRRVVVYSVAAIAAVIASQLFAHSFERALALVWLAYVIHAGAQLLAALPTLRELARLRPPGAPRLDDPQLETSFLTAAASVDVAGGALSVRVSLSASSLDLLVRAPHALVRPSIARLVTRVAVPWTAIESIERTADGFIVRHVQPTVLTPLVVHAPSSVFDAAFRRLHEASLAPSASALS
ncbi:MAG: hypothetical protein U0235_34840 [Polyangiaceae bacterium]